MDFRPSLIGSFLFALTPPEICIISCQGSLQYTPVVYIDSWACQGNGGSKVALYIYIPIWPASLAPFTHCQELGCYSHDRRRTGNAASRHLGAEAQIIHRLLM